MQQFPYICVVFFCVPRECDAVVVVVAVFWAPQQQVIVSRRLLLHESFQRGPQRMLARNNLRSLKTRLKMAGKKRLPRSWHPRKSSSFDSNFLGVAFFGMSCLKKKTLIFANCRKQTMKLEHEVWKRQPQDESICWPFDPRWLKVTNNLWFHHPKGGYDRRTVRCNSLSSAQQEAQEGIKSSLLPSES